MEIKLRRKIIEDSDLGLSAFTMTKKYELTMQVINCVLLFRDMDDSTFVCIEDGDINKFTIAHIANLTDYDHDTIKRLLRTYTATEIIQDKEIIKVCKDRR